VSVLPFFPLSPQSANAAPPFFPLIQGNGHCFFSAGTIRPSLFSVRAFFPLPPSVKRKVLIIRQLDRATPFFFRRQLQWSSSFTSTMGSPPSFPFFFSPLPPLVFFLPPSLETVFDRSPFFLSKAGQDCTNDFCCRLLLFFVQEYRADGIFFFPRCRKYNFLLLFVHEG